jgi:hypothetical protein
MSKPFQITNSQAREIALRALKARKAVTLAARARQAGKTDAEMLYVAGGKANKKLHGYIANIECTVRFECADSTEFLIVDDPEVQSCE